MRRRSGVLMGTALALAVGAATLQASCTAPRSGVSEGRRNVAADRVPPRYRDRIVVYSTGDSDVLSLRLDGSKPKLLFHSRESLDSRGLLLPIPERRELLYDCINKRVLNLMRYSIDTGERGMLDSEVSYPLVAGVEGTRSVVVYSTDRNEARIADLATGKTRPLAMPGPVLSVSSSRSAGQAFVVARSDVRSDPIDQDLYFRPVGGRLIKVASAPREFGFGDVHVLPGAVLFNETPLGGERDGTVRVWSARSRTAITLASDARVLDVSADGVMLLAERVSRREEQTPDGLAVHESSRIVYLSGPSQPARRLPGVYEDLQWVRLADDDRAVLSFIEGRNWQLDALDLLTGRRTRLALPATRVIAQIEPLDGSSVLVVTDRNGPGGIPADSNLLWMPLDGSQPVPLVTTDSGFIRIAAPYVCRN